MKLKKTEASKATSVNQLNKYDVGYDDIIRLINGSEGDRKYITSIEGDSGGNSCWHADYGIEVIRGECKILSKEEVLNETKHISSILIPESKFCVVIEYKYYNDLNGRNEESETFHFFTITSGWKKVTVYIQ